jgi:hypothetical protein
LPSALAPRKAGADTLGDDAALKLGEDPQHLKHRLACPRRVSFC